MPDIGATIGGAFRLIRERPGAVLAWGAVSVFGGLAVAGLRTQIGAAPTAQGAMPRIDFAGAFGDLLLDLLGVGIQAIVLAAVFRAVLAPGDPRRAEMRVGMDELRIGAMLVVLQLLFAGAALFGTLIGLFLTSLGYLASGGSMMAAMGAAWLLGALLVGGIVVLAVRLCVAMPLVLVREKLGIDESWERTRGHFWSLLAIFLIVALVLMALWGMGMLAVMGADAADSTRGGDWPSWLVRIIGEGAWLRAIVAIAVDCILTGVSAALSGGAMAHALLRLPGSAVQRHGAA